MELYRNASAPIEKRVSDLLGRMTIEEKIGQMAQLPANRPGMMDLLEKQHIGSYLHCTGDMMRDLQLRAERMRLGIPLIFGIDAIHGHCFDPEGTVFPTQLAQGCSWDREMINNIGRITAREVRATGIHWTFSPVLCVGRDLRWGRVDETFGEDPWLIGELAMEIIRGYQGGDITAPDAILACAKHYVAYGEATGGRDAYESEVSRRKLLSLFLPPFQKAMLEAGCATMMTAYQSIDGQPCSANEWLLRTVPKEQWNMEGFIVTDWDNVGSLYNKQHVAADEEEATQIAIEAGNDMMMSTPFFYEHAVRLVTDGKINISLIDDSVKRILKYKFLLGLFGERRHADPSARAQIVGHADHHEAALEAARKTIVLLENRNDALPLNAKTGDTLLICGSSANDVVAQLGDWSFGSMQAGATDDGFHRKTTTTILDGITKRAAQNGIEVRYEPGVSNTGNVPGDVPDRFGPDERRIADSEQKSIDEAIQAASGCAAAVVVIGDTLVQHGEFHDRGDLRLSPGQEALVSALSELDMPTIVVYLASKPLAIGPVARVCDALVCAFNPGEAGGRAVAETLFGDVNPSGKLPISFPVSAGQLPVYYNQYSGWHSQNDSRMAGEERYFDLPAEPLYPFGYGLSYTGFSYANLRVSPGQVAPGQDVTATIEVTNTGSRAGVEIVQLYINDVASSVTTPVKELRGFTRVDIEPGQTVTATIPLNYDDLSLINADLERVVEPGEFEIMVGGSSRDFLCTTITVD
jgi:beta-glucosidase